MKEICILLMVMLVIINLAGLMLGMPATPEKLSFIFWMNSGAAIITLLSLIFEKRK